MKNNKLNFYIIKSIFLPFIFSILFISCKEQNKTTLSEEHEKVTESSISIPADSLPEFRTDLHETEYQGNQISGVVRTMFQDKKGYYWFGTQNGLSRYDGKSLVYFDIKNDLGKGITVKAIDEDIAGNIWIGHSGGITKYDGEYFTNFNEKNGLINNDVWSLAADSQGKIWIGTLQGACSFDGNVFSHLNIPEAQPDTTKGVSSGRMIHSIMEDSKGRLWFGTNGGAYIFDGKTLTGISEKDGLCNNYINSVIEDKEGNFWFATSQNGLCRFDGTTITNVTESLLDKGMGVGSIIEDKKGNKWFSSNKGRNVYSCNGKNFTKYSIEGGDRSHATFQIYQDQNERIWFVGFKGIYRLDDKTFVNITRDGLW